MGRPLRRQVENGLYHVTSRGARQLPLFIDDIDYARVTGMLAKEIRRSGWECHSYCFMPNHLHVLLRIRHQNLSAGMQRLKHGYAIRFNLRHGFEGHAFDRRFCATLVETEQHLLNCLRYIALNPVDAGFCELPQDWPHSSFRATAGLTPVPPFLDVDFVRGLFSDDPAAAAAAFAEFVVRGLDELAA